MYLRRPDDAGWLGGYPPGSAAVIRHAYGALDVSRSAVLTDTDRITVTWALTPTWRMSGVRHNVYLRAEDLGGGSSGWEDRGDWAINRPPVWLIPPSLINTDVTAGTRYTFDPRYRDLDGWRTWRVLYFAIADRPPTGEMAPGGVFLKYDQSSNRMYLANSAGTAWLGGVTPGTVTILENDAVKVIVQWSSVGAMDANTRIVRWRLEFKGAFRGRHRVYMRGIDNLAECGGDKGWKWKGWLRIQ